MTYDVIVIGAGIAGLAHAWMAARRRLRVLVLERTPRAEGASIRNFGMVWPIGQPAGERTRIALQSREHWLELGQAGVLDVAPCGSIHLAHHRDEWAVLQEFHAQSELETRLWSPAEVRDASPLAESRGLLGGLFSPSELRVDPRKASDRIAAWLQEQHGVSFRMGTAVTHVETGLVRVATGETFPSERIVLCCGAEAQALFPEEIAQCGLRRCKLQMLRTVPQAGLPVGTPHLASGLTLRHYRSFEICPSLAGLRARIASEAPELDRLGIHVMASAFPTGEVILGDSHEYGEDISPFDRTEIDDLILRECRHVFHLSDWSIAQRWSGVYVKHPELEVIERELRPGVQLFTGLGGAGMTMSFGLAERSWNRWLGTNSR